MSWVRMPRKHVQLILAAFQCFAVSMPVKDEPLVIACAPKPHAASPSVEDRQPCLALKFHIWNALPLIRLRSFSLMICLTISRCMAIFSRSISRRSSASCTAVTWRPGEADDCADGGVRGLPPLLVLDTLRASSSTKGSSGKRSSSERKELAGYSWSSSQSDDRRGHEGKAQDASCPLT